MLKKIIAAAITTAILVGGTVALGEYKEVKKLDKVVSNIEKLDQNLKVEYEITYNNDLNIIIDSKVIEAAEVREILKDYNLSHYNNVNVNVY